MSVTFPSDEQTEAALDAARPRVLRRIHRRRRTTRAAVIGGALLAASSGTAGTFVVAQAGHEEIAYGVVCFAHDDLGSLSSGGQMVQPDGSPGKPIDLGTKREMCGLAWRAGMKEAAANGGRWPADIDPNTSTIPVPSLAFCRLPDGVSGGFPVEAPSRTPAEVCERLGLALLG